MNLTSVFRWILLLIGLLLFIDGFYLISLKKIHLGTVLPLLIGLAFCIYAIWHKKIQIFLTKHPKLNKLWKTGIIFFSLWIISLFSFFYYIQNHIKFQSDRQNLDAIIVLGSGVTQGKPSDTLAKRLDQAAIVAQSNSNALIILTGGLDFGEKDTEAEVMARYLQESYHLDSHKIALEDKSTSTELNLKNSQSILKQHGLNLNSNIAIVTSDFHTIRAAAIAKKQHYTHVDMISAPTPLLTRYNAWLREYFAYISGWVLNEY